MDQISAVLVMHAIGIRLDARLDAHHAFLIWTQKVAALATFAARKLMV
jgi:hypothetical protein